jgi:hypothetical protein
MSPWRFMPLVRSVDGGYTTFKMYKLNNSVSSWQFGVMLACFAATVLSLVFFVSQPAIAQDEADDEDRLWTQQSCTAEGGSWIGTTETCDFSDQAQDESPNFLINRYINPLIIFLAGVVGLVVVISVVIGGIQYSSAGDDPQKIAKAKSRIVSSLLALLAFFFLFAFLEWIVPGGIVR